MASLCHFSLRVSSRTKPSLGPVLAIKFMAAARLLSGESDLLVAQTESMPQPAGYSLAILVESMEFPVTDD